MTRTAYRSRPILFSAALAIALLIAGCKKAPEPAPEPENVEQPANETITLPEPKPEEKPAPKPHKLEVPADHSEVSVDEQMREDAEATGMTSRRPSEDDDSVSPSGDSNTQN